MDAIAGYPAVKSSQFCSFKRNQHFKCLHVASPNPFGKAHWKLLKVLVVEATNEVETISEEVFPNEVSCEDEALPDHCFVTDEELPDLVTDEELPDLEVNSSIQTNLHVCRHDCMVFTGSDFDSIRCKFCHSERFTRCKHVNCCNKPYESCDPFHVNTTHYAFLRLPVETQYHLRVPLK